MNTSRFFRLAVIFSLMASLMIPFSKTTAEDNPGLIYLVDVYGKFIRVINWAADTVANITILDESGTVIFQDWLSPGDYDDCGFFKETCAQYMLPDSVSLAPLRTIIAAADGHVTVHHVVADVHVTSVDIETDTISGTVNPPREPEYFYPLIFDTECNGTGEFHSTFDEFGNWSWDVSEACDLTSRSWGPIHYNPGYSVEDDYYAGWQLSSWWAGNPSFIVRANNNIVEAFQWYMGSTITLEIDDPETEPDPDFSETRSVDEVCPWDQNQTYELFEIGSDEIDIQPGFLVRMTDGVITKTHTVTTLAFTDIDVDTDVVTGVAAAGSSVQIITCDEHGCYNLYPDPVADENGTWSADFTSIYDIVFGTWIDSTQPDEDGDSTNFGQNVPRPVIEVRANDNIVEVYQWRMGSTVTLEIDDPSTELAPDYFVTRLVDELCPSDPNLSYEYFEVGSEIDIQPGFLVRMTDGVVTKTHTVTTVAITDIDVDTDVVTGVAAASSSVNTYICDDYGCNNPDPDPVTDENGIWTYDFTGIYDIVLGTWVEASQYDEDGDSTLFRQHVPRPVIEVRANDNIVDAFQWQMGSTINLEIDDPGTEPAPDFSETRSVDELCPWDPSQTCERFEVGNEIDIQPGFLVRMTDGITTKTHEVTTLAITAIDADTDVVTGVAAASSSVDIWICDDLGCYNPDPNPVADENGIWTYDFTGFYDIVPGTWVDSSQFDEDGDGTLFAQQVPRPYFDVRANWDQVGAWEWPLGATLTLEIDDPATPGEPDFSTTQVANLHPDEPRSYADFSVGDSIDIQPGFEVSLSDGTTTKSLTVSPLSFTSVDIVNDKVYGVADPDVQVGVWACDESGCYNYHTTSDSLGAWMVDMTQLSDQGVPFNIVGGTWIDSEQRNEYSDSTMFGWNAPNPRIRALPAVNEVDGYDWPMGASVQLTIDDDTDPYNGTLYENTKTVEGMDWVWNHTSILFLLWEDGFTLQPGQYITMTDGNTIKTHWVTILSVTTIDSAADTVSGKAAPGSSVGHWAYDENSSTNRHVAADENGDWIADFAHVGEGDDEQVLMDIRAGVGGDVYQEDEDGDYTEVQWRVPTPRIKVFLEENRIDGFDWTDGMPIILTVDDPLTTQSPDFTSTQVANVTSEDIEQAVVSFDPGGLTLRPGMLVTMTDGTTTKSHIILDHGWISIDYDQDVISGWGEPGFDAVIWVYQGITGRARHFLPDADGRWTASFAEQGDEDWETVFDILPGMSGGMTQKDADQDETIRLWSDISMATNQPPVISAISAPIDPVQLGQSITASVTFSDPDAGDAHTITWDWGDGLTNSGPSTSADHLYAQAGVYTVTVTVTDGASESDTAMFQYVVIYDPSDGFVTGGGWINSPQGAYKLDETLTGKATFGFVSKYLKGAKVPSGNTEFQFQAGSFKFQSTSYDWLVVSKNQVTAQFKGSGMVNGALAPNGNPYKFMLWAGDGTPDTFRIRIWWEDAAGEHVIYDNGFNQAIGGGSIVVHTGK